MPAVFRGRRGAAAVGASLAVILAVPVGVIGVVAEDDGGRGAIARMGHTETSRADDVEFRDDAAGFTIRYPAGWTRLETADPQVRVAAARGQSASFLVRVLPLPFEAQDDDGTKAVKALADGVVGSAAGTEMLQAPRRVTVSGRPSWKYVYRFRDRSTGKFGVHAHYFVPDGDRLVTIVLQALPETRYDDLTAALERILASFELVTPDNE